MLEVKAIDLRFFNMRTRIPFKYGITTLRACPHVFLKLTCEIDGARISGIAADHLPPKWFTKNPQTPFEDDVDEMIQVIRHAADHAVLAGRMDDVYTLVSRIHLEQSIWAREKNWPGLLAQFGTSLTERAIIDAFCRAKGITFFQALRQNALGIRFSGFADERLMLDYQELGTTRPAHWIPPQPLERVYARFTVGMLDYLTEEEIPADERVNDGLPQSLEAAVRHYGLAQFKLKLAGNADADLPRLRRIFGLVSNLAPSNWSYTLDANENFKDVASFRALWEALRAEASLKDALARLYFIEQPFHRDMALSPAVKAGLAEWKKEGTLPPIIIDESDGFPGAALEALDCGYAGASHKNCKGVIKGVANAALIAKRRRDNPGQRYILSGEDLANVGPVALLQDLAVCAALGIESVERNGHHYFRGLSMHSQAVQEEVLHHHPDLYQVHPGGFAALKVQDGQLSTRTVSAAPFGTGFEMQTSGFMTLAEFQKSRSASS